MSRDYKPAQFHEIPKANYSLGRWRTASNLIVVHVSGGSAESAHNTFKDPQREASYHYLIDFDGVPWQFVREEHVAWHAGYWSWNQRSFGIGLAGSLEHNRDKTEQMYDSLARLINHLCGKYDIPLRRHHIKGHYQVPGCSQPGRGGVTCHADPGDDFRWRHLLLRAHRYARDGG